MATRKRPVTRQRPTSEQPTRSVLRRWRHNGQDWVELECGHTEPASDYPMATALRCSECNPVRRVPAPTPESSW